MIVGYLQMLFTLATRNVLRNPRRSFLTLLAISFGISSTLLLSALARGVSEQLVTDTIKKLRGHIQVHAEGYMSDPASEKNFVPSPDKIALLSSKTEAIATSSRVRVPAVVQSERESSGLLLLGIDPPKERSLSFIMDVPVEGRMLESPSDTGIIIGKALAEQLQTGLGKRIVIMATDTELKLASRGFRIIGIFDAELEGTERAYAFTGLNTAQQLLKMGDAVSEVSMLLERRDDLGDLLKLAQMLFPKQDAATWETLEPLAYAMSQLQDGFLLIWLFIVLVAVAFGLVNTLFMAIYERTREIGLLQALGLKPRLILIEVLFESAVLLLVGLIAGNILYGLGLYFLQGGIDISQFAEATEMIQISSIIYPYVQLQDIVVANVFVFLLSMLSSLYPAWQAARLVPMDAITRL